MIMATTQQPKSFEETLRHLADMQTEMLGHCYNALHADTPQAQRDELRTVLEQLIPTQETDE